MTCGRCRKRAAVSRFGGEGGLLGRSWHHPSVFSSLSKVWLDPSGPYVLNYLLLAHVCRSGISFILLSFIFCLISPFCLCPTLPFIMPLPPRPPPLPSPFYLPVLPTSPFFICPFMCFLDKNLLHIKSSNINDAAGKNAVCVSV